MVVHLALRGFSRSANNLYVLFTRILLAVEANIQIKNSDPGLAWVLNTKKGLCFIVKPHRTHSFEAV